MQSVAASRENTSTYDGCASGGRFMGIDAARFSEGNLHSFNRYAYGNNNLLRFIDPDGNDAIDSIKSFVLAPFEKIALMVTVNQHRKSREYGADSLRPFNLTWWRGGGAAIGDIFLDNTNYHD